MAIHETSAVNLLRLVRAETEAIGVAISFGKDSLATLDLCCRVFRRVEAYYLFRVRGLALVDGWASQIEQRWHVIVRMYPHFDLSRCYRNAVLSPHWRGAQRCPKLKLTDVEARFRADAGVEWLAMGWRRNDSFNRAIILKSCAGYDVGSKRVFPLRSWRRQDVLDYLDRRKIPVPPGLGRKEQGGLDFDRGALIHLRDHHPEDYRQWLRDFPFSGIQLLERETTPASL